MSDLKLTNSFSDIGLYTHSVQLSKVLYIKEPLGLSGLPSAGEPVAHITYTSESMLSEHLTEVLPTYRSLFSTPDPLPSVPGTSEPLSSVPSATKPLPGVSGTSEPLSIVPGAPEHLPSVRGASEPVPSVFDISQALFSVPGTSEPLHSVLGASKLSSVPGTCEPLPNVPDTNEPSSIVPGALEPLSRVSNEQVSNNDSNKCMCELCGKLYNSKKWLSKHLRMKHQRLTNSVEICPAEIHEYKCNECVQIFTAESSLRRHMNSVHGSVKLVFECNFCHKLLSRRHDLKVHIENIHKGHNKQLCYVCGAEVKGRQSLAAHMITHASVKPFTCEECGGQFCSRFSLTQHKAVIHRYEGVDYVCEECGKSFITNTYLRRHQRSVHAQPMGTVHCNKCNRTFTGVCVCVT